MHIFKLKRVSGENRCELKRYDKALGLLVRTGHIDKRLGADCRASLPDAKSAAEALVEQKIVARDILSKALAIAEADDTDDELRDEDVFPGEKQLHDAPQQSLGEDISPPLAEVEKGPPGIDPPVGSIAGLPIVAEPQPSESPTVPDWAYLLGPVDESPGENPGFTASFTFKACADNAPEVVRDTSLAVTPPIRTELAIEETVHPASIVEDELTEVRWALVVKNTRRAVADNVVLSLEHLPLWFKVTEAMVEGETLPGSDNGLRHIEVGDIGPGESKSIVLVGIASP